MNVSEECISEIGYDVQFRTNESIMERMFGRCESRFSYEILQFEDYSKVVFSYADPSERVERRKTVFPKDCEAAYNLGKRLVSEK